MKKSLEYKTVRIHKSHGPDKVKRGIDITKDVREGAHPTGVVGRGAEAEFELSFNKTRCMASAQF